MVEMYNTWQGYVIRKSKGKWWLYLAWYRNGKYKWVTNHLYAHHYTKRVAEYHMGKLKGDG